MVWKLGERKDFFSLRMLTLAIQPPYGEAQARYVTVGEKRERSSLPCYDARKFQSQLPSYWSHRRDPRWGQRMLLWCKGLNAQHTQKPTLQCWFLRKERGVLRGGPARRQEARLKCTSPFWGSAKLLWVRGGRLGRGGAGGRFWLEDTGT